MPQPEIRERRPSAKQVVLNKAKDKVGKPNTKSHKKRQAKKTADDSPSEESSSDDENQPQKRDAFYNMGGEYVLPIFSC
jgi:hypothetical protein